MKVYLANKYENKHHMRDAATLLRSKGIEVTSTWIDEPQRSGTNKDWAFQDLLEISQADCLVFFSESPTEPTLRGGRHVEYGYALGIRKPIIVVGPKENIFHNLPQIKHFDTWEDAVYFLERKSKRRI